MAAVVSAAAHCSILTLQQIFRLLEHHNHLVLQKIQTKNQNIIQLVGASLTINLTNSISSECKIAQLTYDKIGFQYHFSF